MKKSVWCVLVLALALFGAQSASAQAIVSWVGGSEFDIFYGGSTGDVVGFRFQVNELLAVGSLGAWDADSAAPSLSENDPQAGLGKASPALDSNHMVGIWDDAQMLIASATVTPASTLIDDFRYEAITPVVLEPGILYTIGALYVAGDSDNYISSATGLVTDPTVTWVNAVFPSVGSLGFVFPTEDSAPTSQGRFGPNFIAEVVPVELQSFEVE